jgi:ribonuclease Y
MNQLFSGSTAVVVVLATGLGLLLAWVISKKWIADAVTRATEQAQRVLHDAERDAETRKKEIVLEAKEDAHQLQRTTEEELRLRQAGMADHERSLGEETRTLAAQRSEMERLEETVRQREAAVSTQGQEVARQTERYAQLVTEQQRELQRVSGMTADEAKDTLLRQLVTEARLEAAHLVTKLEHEARENAADKAKHIIAQAIQRSAPEHAIETTVSVVDLPSDDLKGRIIGREGRNIRALEVATGVELIVDDTPGAIILSSFDPYRRAVAKQAIESLIADGRIHPARIEEVVERVRAEVDEAAQKEGEAAGFELGLHDLHPELYRLMGRLKFRTSYGQNVLSHSKEVAYLAGIMARELGLDAHVSVRAAFLHDIGKAIDRELQGTHLELGIDLLRQHGESDAVVDAMAAHHMDIDWPSLEAMLVQAADAISAARPGARRDILESYIKRLEKLENIADSFKGGSKAFALQAGREIRIMVESDQVSDEEAVWLSKDIAKRVENELEYPGQIKVTVIRETRAIDYAR